MTLNNIKTLRKDRGFTIVELLIVIVVIAILAAITIVAYNGIQNRSKTTASASAGNTVIKKAEAYNSINNSYPTAVGNLNSTATAEANLAGSGITLAADITAAPASPATVQYINCSGTGAKVTTWDYAAGAKAAYTYLGAATAANCTATTGGFAGGPY
jgi:prepilin-type N-terminal cleavage/methylation domain-containing protein